MEEKPVSLYVVTSSSTYEHWLWGDTEPMTEETGVPFHPLLDTPKFGIAYQTIHSQNERPYRRVFEEDVDQKKLDKLIDQMKNQQQLEHNLF